MKKRGRVPEHLQTQEELARLVKLSQVGEEGAKTELAWRMRPLVINVAARYQKAEGHAGRYYNREDEDDIEMAAWIGLWEAVERYSPSHKSGKKFWTVANYRINHHVKEWVARNSGSISMPRVAWRQAYDVDMALEQEGMEDWEKYTPEQLKEATGVHSAAAILNARRKAWQIDPDNDAQGSPSAEQEYLDMTEAQNDLENTVDAMSTVLQFQDESEAADTAESYAWDFIDRQEIPSGEQNAVVDKMLAMAKENVGL